METPSRSKRFNTSSEDAGPANAYAELPQESKRGSFTKDALYDGQLVKGLAYRPPEMSLEEYHQIITQSVDPEPDHVMICYIRNYVNQTPRKPHGWFVCDLGQKISENVGAQISRCALKHRHCRRSLAVYLKSIGYTLNEENSWITRLPGEFGLDPSTDAVHLVVYPENSQFMSRLVDEVHLCVTKKLTGESAMKEISSNILWAHFEKILGANGVDRSGGNLYHKFGYASVDQYGVPLFKPAPVVHAVLTDGPVRQKSQSVVVIYGDPKSLLEVEDIRFMIAGHQAALMSEEVSWNRLRSRYGGTIERVSLWNRIGPKGEGLYKVFGFPSEGGFSCRPADVMTSMLRQVSVLLPASAEGSSDGTRSFLACAEDDQAHPRRGWVGAEDDPRPYSLWYRCKPIYTPDQEPSEEEMFKTTHRPLGDHFNKYATLAATKDPEEAFPGVEPAPDVDYEEISGWCGDVACYIGSKYRMVHMSWPGGEKGRLTTILDIWPEHEVEGMKSRYKRQAIRLNKYLNAMKEACGDWDTFEKKLRKKITTYDSAPYDLVMAAHWYLQDKAKLEPMWCGDAEQWRSWKDPDFGYEGWDD